MCSTGWPRVTYLHSGHLDRMYDDCTEGDRGPVLSMALQDLEQWVTLGHTALQLLYSAAAQIRVWVPENVHCLEPMHFPHTTEWRTHVHKVLRNEQVPPAPL
ncbi:hypothetical protein TNCT_39911 [Trichonephila clavata]|uniref:Uncharacterized protein n=1 Tax=Trichonephila clavata TaxID=2740835 RepID=A0A8X6KSL3_TRICU|nr:hypothetical protein TNCT_39911 [Trichonephila clavata]